MTAEPKQDTGRPGPLRAYRSAARAAVGLSIAPYGYTLTVWTSGAVVTHAHGLPDALDAFLFMLGAVAGFGSIALLAHGSLRTQATMHSTPPRFLAGLHVPAVGLAIAAAALITHPVPRPAVWPLAGFASTAIYLAVLAAQLALAG